MSLYFDNALLKDKWICSFIGKCLQVSERTNQASYIKLSKPLGTPAEEDKVYYTQKSVVHWSIWYLLGDNLLFYTHRPRLVILSEDALRRGWATYEQQALTSVYSNWTFSSRTGSTWGLDLLTSGCPWTYGHSSSFCVHLEAIYIPSSNLPHMAVLLQWIWWYTCCLGASSSEDWWLLAGPWKGHHHCPRWGPSLLFSEAQGGWRLAELEWKTPW